MNLYRKRLFIALMLTSLLLLIGVAAVSSYLLLHNGSTWVNIVLWTLGIIAVIFFLTIGFGLLFLVVSLWREKTAPSIHNLIQAAVSTLFPFALALGKLFGIEQEQIKSSFIAVNNQLVKLRAVKVRAHEIMILAPHCLQRTTCKHKITIDVENCHRCGKCSIDKLLELKERYGVNLAVATGGTLARSFVKKYRPRAIIAIACERDLTSGIMDTNPLPVFGVINIRPEGPCFNTGVSLSQVEEAVRSFLSIDKKKKGQGIFEQPLYSN